MQIKLAFIGKYRFNFKVYFKSQFDENGRVVMLLLRILLFENAEIAMMVVAISGRGTFYI